MARIKLGAMAQDVRGSIAGTTFSKSRSGATARQKVSPVQPNTARQSIVRSIQSTVSKAYRTIGAASMALWRTWAVNHAFPNVFGDPMHLAPNAAFGKVNGDLANLAEVWGAEGAFPLALPLTTPPADPTDPPAAAISVAAVAATGVVTITTEAQEVSTGFYGIWVTPGMSPGRVFAGNMYRLVGGLPTTAAASTLVVTPADVNDRVDFVAGQNVSVIVARYAESGALIDQTRLDCVAGA